MELGLGLGLGLGSGFRVRVGVRGGEVYAVAAVEALDQVRHHLVKMRVKVEW